MRNGEVTYITARIFWCRLTGRSTNHEESELEKFWKILLLVHKQEQELYLFLFFFVLGTNLMSLDE